MSLRPRQIVAAVLALGFAVLVQLAPAKQKDTQSSASTEMDQERRAVHALNRLAFGPRPGDVERVRAMGVDHWIDRQLHPERIDDGALDARLAAFRTLKMGTHELMENFPSGEIIKAVAEGKRSLPSDPLERAVYQAELDRYQEKQERKPENGASSSLPGDAASQPGRAGDQGHTYADEKAQQLLEMPPDQRVRAVLQMSADERRTLTASLRGRREEFLEGMKPRDRETLLALNDPRQVVDGELAQAKLLRAIYGERQLEEVMTDFWFNHFNVFVDKGIDRLLITSYERDVIRPRALGKFEDLLVATAKSPAMLFYLDNWLSVGPDSAQALGIPPHPGPYGRRYPARPNPGKRPSGLNENYGRELLELHTLSVNGGYSQRDVTEVAKVFTGWTIDKPYQGGSFKFDPRMHQPGPKFVLGRRIKPKGEEEGLEVLHRLATSPQTAHFISLKLAERFVADDPPPALVDRMAKAFLKKKGDIREIMTVLLHSPEFWEDGTYRDKVKTPLEFVASAVRATGAEVDDATPLARQLNNMGMPLYGAQPPTGYSMKAETWVSSSALLNRMNFALALTSGKIKGVKVDAALLVGSSSESPDAAATLARLETSLVVGGVSQQTHDSIVAQIDAAGENGAQSTQGGKAVPSKPTNGARPPDVSTIAGLLLGSPEFQRR